MLGHTTETHLVRPGPENPILYKGYSEQVTLSQRRMSRKDVIF